MRELYIEGVAIHGGPDHAWMSVRASAKRWTGVRAGWAIEPRNQGVRGADAVNQAGRQHRWWRYGESPGDPARSENLCMYGIFMRENREIPRSAALLITGRAAQETLRR